MKRVIAILFVVLYVLMTVVTITGCGNQNIFDTVWSFEKAIIFLPNGERIEGTVKSWDDFEGSDMLQVNIDGTVYLTHSSNVILVSTD